MGIMSPEIGQLATYPPKLRTNEAIAAAMADLEAASAAAVASGVNLGGGFILEKVIGPLSNGDLRLVTTNVSDNPEVTFNYFADPVDLQRCVEGIRTIEQIINADSFVDFKLPELTTTNLLNITSSLPVNLIPKHTNDSTSLEQFCRDTVTTIWHYHGGCQVGPCIDPNHHVLGVDALRVIDGSTWNNSPGTNPQATVMMLGR
jgi:choline dehydrogenase